MRRADTRQRMTELVRQWYAGNEPQLEFARRHGVSRAKLRYWIRRLPPDTSVSTPVRFTPVRVVGDDSVTGVLEIALPSGARVVVHQGASAGLITQVLTALRAC